MEWGAGRAGGVGGGALPPQPTVAWFISIPRYRSGRQRTVKKANDGGEEKTHFMQRRSMKPIEGGGRDSSYLPVGSTQMRPHVLSFFGNADGIVLTDWTNRSVGLESPFNSALAATTSYSYTLIVEDSSLTTYAAFFEGWKELEGERRKERGRGEGAAGGGGVMGRGAGGEGFFSTR